MRPGARGGGSDCGDVEYSCIANWCFMETLADHQKLSCRYQGGDNTAGLLQLLQGYIWIIAFRSGHCSSRKEYNTCELSGGSQQSKNLWCLGRCVYFGESL